MTTLTCPICHHTEAKEIFWNKPTNPDCHPMCRLLPKSECQGFFGMFKQGPTRELYACPKCGVAFIIP